MSIKTSQAILKSSLAFGLRWAQKTKPCFVTLRTFFSSTAGQGFQNTKWPAVPGEGVSTIPQKLKYRIS